MIFSSRRFLQKTNERILLYYYETSGQLVFVRFQEEIEDTKKDISKLSDVQAAQLWAAPVPFVVDIWGVNHDCCYFSFTEWGSKKTCRIHKTVTADIVLK